MEQSYEDVSARLSSLSIVVDDVDERRNRTCSQTKSEEESNSKNEQVNQTLDSASTNVQNPYPRHVLEDAIRDVLEEAELRKFEFRKLLDEHDALVKNLKRMEKETSSSSTFMCNVAHSPIMT